MERKKDNVTIPSAASILEQLRSNPDYMAKHAERERRRDAFKEEFERSNALLLSDLAAVGLNYSSTEELRQSGEHYEKAIPILLRWLPNVVNQGLKESIIRALSVPWAKPAAALPLVAEFKTAEKGRSDSLKWVIGNALAVVADDSVFNEVAELVRDNRNGKAREMLALAMGNMHDPRAVDVLIELLDGEVAGFALIALGRLGDRRARPHLEPLLRHPIPWVRKEAKKALSKLDKRHD